MNTTPVALRPPQLAPEEAETILLKTAGPLRGKQVLDLGCGDGRLAVLAARRGARVTAVDISDEAVRSARALAREYGAAGRVTVRRMNALDLAHMGQHFDVALGRFILHEIEPFDAFTSVLHEVIKDGGRGVFYENSARNPVLRFARAALVGRFGIPKYGHAQEYPLEPSELQILDRQFDWVEVYYPRFVFFQLINTYIFRHNLRFEPIMNTLTALDQWVEDAASPLKRYSYHQIVEVGK